MSDMKYGAIDSKFELVQNNIQAVAKDLGKLENRVEVLEGIANSHSNGLIAHEGSIERMAKDMEQVSSDIKRILKALYLFTGALIIINMGFGAVMTYLVNIASAQ
jgi:peptidoglycan hydrolase CwlO-like protein